MIAAADARSQDRRGGKSPDLPPRAKARRIGMAAMIGGKRKTEIREATPTAFRDVMISIAASVETFDGAFS